MKTADDINEGSVIRTQVCVIGSGAGGGVAATRLAELGVSTVLVEEGDYVPTDEMTQDELEMLPRLFQEEGRRANSDQSISILQGRSLGGGTYHNTGFCVPVEERTWSQWQRDHAVPVPFAEFDGYQNNVMKRILARVADDDEINPNNRVLLDGAKRLGLRHFVAHHNRICCSGCGFCTLGCAYNRKLSVVHAFLPDGLRQGLEIITGAEAHAVRESGDGCQVSIKSGSRTFRVDADVVVVSAGAVHTPLLLDRSRRGPVRQLGTRLRLHPFAAVGGVFDDEIVSWRGVPQSVIVDDHAHCGPNGHSGYRLIAAAAQPATTAVMTPALGHHHRDAMLSYRRMAMGGVLLHDVTQGRVRRRQNRPRIDYWPNRGDMATLRSGIRLLAELYFEMGARRVVLPFHELPVVDPSQLDRIQSVPLRRHSVLMGSVHPQGTCAMGGRASDSVTNGNGQVHGSDRMFVADTSLFPTSVGVPPQVTTMALAWRLADHIAMDQRALLS